MLKNMKLLISENLLVVPPTIEILILLNTVITGSCTLPIHIHTVILREVRLADSYILKFNQECRKVRFYHCSGEYDLSGIQKLEVLGLVPELKGTLELKVCLPSLDNVRKLDIAYNLNEDCLEYCLARYINLESLTIRSIDYREKCLPYPRLSLVKDGVFNPSNMNAWLIQKMSEYELPREHLGNETANLLNIKMNIFMGELFTFNVKNKLKYLKLIGCSLSGRNMKMLKEFVNLQTLVIDSAFLGNEMIKNIPCQLETLEIMDRNIYKDLFINLRKLDWKTVQLLRKHKSIKHLVLDKSIMKYEHIFNCLPVKLESLKFKKFFGYGIGFHAQNKEKIIVKRLVLLLDDPNTNPIMVIDNNPMVRQYYQLFDLLQNYIDFTKLEDLALETPIKTVSLDRRTYRIK
ncbi:putative LRR containing protein [Trachipleistophora hominis]|uniref:Putative LRR containing protein n=1 Tax=Trachipleistophora hominis TaxID=72359 RepID=L7JVF0_TRAHO|nr:putative LRR containing protein [Trachipleistophora hominis]